jgi:hypothetical protein
MLQMRRAGRKQSEAPMYMLIRGADICMYSCPRASRRPQRVYVRGRQPRAEQLLHLQGGNVRNLIL